MNWRDIIVGGIITLIVSVVAGVIVWFLTAGPKVEPQKEKIVFSFDRSAALKSERSAVSVVNLRIANFGSASARNVVGVVQFSSGEQVEETQVKSSAGISTLFKQNLTNENRRLLVEIESLAPSEVITVSSLLRGEQGEPEISVRSSGSVAERLTILRNTEEVHSGNILNAIPIVISILLPIAIYMVTKDVVRRTLYMRGSHNDFAFMIMHRGNVDFARKVLEDRIERQGGNVYEMVNYALAVGIKGNDEEARMFFEAADYWSEGNGIKALVLFNKSAYSAHRKDYSQCLLRLKEAYRLHPKSIKTYIESSIYIRDAALGDADIKTFVDQHKLVFYQDAG